MNDRQFKTMWTGIGLIAIYGIFLVFEDDRLSGGRFLNFLVWFIVVALVSGGFVVTFSDKRDKGQRKIEE